MTFEEQLLELCNTTKANDGLEAIKTGLSRLKPDLHWRAVMVREGWHRLGGVVDQEHQCITENIAKWVEEVSGGDVDYLLEEFSESGYFATRFAGKTHYFTAPHSDDPKDFIQLEIEELQEVIDRPLIEPDVFPDSIEELLDPVDYNHVEPVKLGEPKYRFRRLTSIPELLHQTRQKTQAQQNLRRFFVDWARSSAMETEHLCRHWIMLIREYLDSDYEKRLQARPHSVYSAAMPELPGGQQLSGSKLAVAIHEYDRKLGYSFAWYFNLLGQKTENLSLIESVLRDQMGAYDYLPAKDIKLLRQWEQRPYAV